MPARTPRPGERRQVPAPPGIARNAAVPCSRRPAACQAVITAKHARLPERAKANDHERRDDRRCDAVSCSRPLALPGGEVPHRIGPDGSAAGDLAGALLAQRTQVNDGPSAVGPPPLRDFGEGAVGAVPLGNLGVQPAFVAGQGIRGVRAVAAQREGTPQRTGAPSR